MSFVAPKRVQAKTPDDAMTDMQPATPARPLPGKRKHEALAREEDEDYDTSDDPFAGFGFAPATQTVTTSPTTVASLSPNMARAGASSTVAKRPSAIDSVSMPLCAPAASAVAAPKHQAKRAKTAASAAAPTISALFAASPASVSDGSPPGPAAAGCTGSGGPAGASSSSLVQTRINDHLDEDWSRIRAMTPSQKSLHFKREALKDPLACRHCNEWLSTEVTLRDHQRACKRMPPPLVFATAKKFASAAVQALLRGPQCLSTYHASWAGSQLLCVSHAHWAQWPADSDERKRTAKALRWLHSMLNSSEGRLDSLTDDTHAASDSSDAGAGEASTHAAEFALHPGQELWLHVLERGGVSNKHYVLSCAAVIQTPLSSDVCERNTERIDLPRPTQTQRALTAFFAQKMNQGASQVTPAAAAAASASSSASVASLGSLGSSAGTAAAPALPPLFGVDKIAVHSSFRFHGLQQDGPSVSLAEHVLRSILTLKHPSLSPDASAPRVAFSEPTQAGKKLARRFTKVNGFLTYALTMHQ